MTDDNEKEQCVLKCKDGLHFFTFPSEDIFRNLWLYKLGLDNYQQSFRVCERHFSESMFASVNNLVELAVPDINLPNTLVRKKKVFDLLNLVSKMKPKAASYTKMENNLLPIQKKIESNPLNILKNTGTNTERILGQSRSNMTLNDSNTVDDVKNWLHDSSNILMDYQLRVQGRHVCDVIELPQYVVVFTITKPKSCPTEPDDSKESSINENVNPPPRGVAVAPETIHIDDNGDCHMEAQKELTPEVDYVYYSTEETIPSREREIQVDMPNYTKEISIQCDIELDNDIIQMTYDLPENHIDSGFQTAQKEKHECHICGEILLNYAAQMRHALGHEKCHSLCPKCGEVFPNRHKLKVHEMDVHWHNSLDMRKVLRCPKINCKKAFHSQKQLNNHIDDHMTRVEYQCNRCMRSFASALKLHCHRNGFKNCLKYSRFSRVQMWSKRRKSLV